MPGGNELQGIMDIVGNIAGGLAAMRSEREKQRVLEDEELKRLAEKAAAAKGSPWTPPKVAGADIAPIDSVNAPVRAQGFLGQATAPAGDQLIQAAYKSSPENAGGIQLANGSLALLSGAQDQDRIRQINEIVGGLPSDIGPVLGGAAIRDPGVSPIQSPDVISAIAAHRSKADAQSDSDLHDILTKIAPVAIEAQGRMDSAAVEAQGRLQAAQAAAAGRVPRFDPNTVPKIVQANGKTVTPVRALTQSEVPFLGALGIAGNVVVPDKAVQDPAQATEDYFLNGDDASLHTLAASMLNMDDMQLSAFDRSLAALKAKATEAGRGLFHDTPVAQDRVDRLSNALAVLRKARGPSAGGPNSQVVGGSDASAAADMYSQDLLDFEAP